jgi:nucleoside-diphosphate-sugar epimerase
MSPVRVAVLGGTGFVGGAVTRALAGCDDVFVTAVSAPRLCAGARDAPGLLAEAGAAAATATLAAVFAGIDVAVNAAGDPDASATDLDRLVGANALMPLAALRAAQLAGVRRFVHVSSAVVQGATETLDESEQRDPFSPYAMSKCLGEEALLAAADSAELVIYRPPSVHGPDRRVTRRIASIACSPLRSVAGGGQNPSPQALIDNVGAAVAYLCSVARPPRVVIHPWEGLTAGALMELFGRGRQPRCLPEPVARWAIRGARATVGRIPGRSADIRRVELLWFGQRQAQSWLTRQGWSPPVGRDGWRQLAEQAASRTT